MQSLSQLNFGTIKLYIPGDPLAWRAHAGYGKRSFNPLYSERTSVQWQVRSQIMKDWGDFDLIEVPVEIEYEFLLPLIKMSRKNTQLAIDGKIYPTKKIDCTNMVKFYEDCLKGIIIKDDSQVMKYSCSKAYSQNPAVKITVRILQVCA